MADDISGGAAPAGQATAPDGKAAAQAGQAAAPAGQAAARAGAGEEDLLGSGRAEEDLLDLADKAAKGGKEADSGRAPLRVEDLELPEGFEFDEETGKSFLDALNDRKLSGKELARRLIDTHAAAMDKVFDRILAAERAKSKEWAAAARADAEYGGSKFDAGIRTIARGRDAVATPEAIAVIRERGLANHPEVLRVFYRAGLMMAEDSSLGPASPSAGGKTDRARAMFGKSLEGVRMPAAEPEDFA